VGIEDLTTKLMALAKQASLSSAQLEEAKATMKALKKLGFSNEEISELSKGRWSSSSVKGYCTGVSAPSPSPWDNAAALLADAIASGISLEGISNALAVSNDLKNKNVSIDEVTELINAAASYSLELTSLAAQSAVLKEAGLSPKEMPGMVAMIEQLEENGLMLASLPALVGLAKNHGNMQNVLEAFSAYGSLHDIEEEIQARQNNLNKLNAENDTANKLLEKRKTELQELTSPLTALKKAKKLGFGEEELFKLSDLSIEWGGTEAVLAAFQANSDLSEIKEQIAESKSELSGWELEINNATTKHGYLISAINMCLALIQDYKFGLDAIASIYSLAQKYGEPLQVLKAIEGYAKIQALQEELVKLEGRVSEEKTMLGTLEGQHQQILGGIEDLVARSHSASQRVFEVEAEFVKSKNFKKLLDLLDNPGMAGFEEEGPLALVIAFSLRDFVKKHGNRFGPQLFILPGLERLIKELGGQ